MLEIRNFAKPYQAETKALILDGLSEYFNPIDEWINEDLNDIYEAYEEKGHNFYVALKDNHIIGTIGLKYHADEAEIVRLSVDRAFRRDGIATMLFQKALEVAKKKGKKSLFVLTDPPWLGAISFYKKIGFVEVSRDEKDVLLIYAI